MARCHQNLDHFLAHRHWDRKLAYHQTKGWFSWDQVTWIKTSLLERILCQLNKLHSPDFIHLPTTIRDIADLSGPRDPNHTPSSPFCSRNPWFNSFWCTNRAWHPTVQESAVLFQLIPNPDISWFWCSAFASPNASQFGSLLASPHSRT